MAQSESFSLDSYIIHHVADAHEWHLPFLPPIHIPEPLTLHAVMLFIASAFMMLTFCVLYQIKARVPRGLTNLLETFVVFIRDEIAIANLGKEEGEEMTPYFCTVFFLILCLNLMGLIPLFSTATANYNVTGGIALTTFFVMVFGAIYKNGVKGFVSAFVPHGLPVPVLFIITPIEFLGLFIKSSALMIRLFANMLAGHIIILALLGIIVILGWAALPMAGLALFIYLLEVLIAFIQAYIFTLLSAIFIAQIHQPAH